MNAWVRFINKTSYNIVYLKTDERQLPLLLIKDIPSRFTLCPAGSAELILYDSKGSPLKSSVVSIRPAKLQTIAVY